MLRSIEMGIVRKGCFFGFGILLLSSYESAQTREPNEPIRADQGKTVVDQLSKNGSGGLLRVGT